VADKIKNTRKVLIVTLCKSLNYGAYLQAFGLQEILRQRGLDPAFLDLYDFKQNIKRFKSLFKKNDRNISGIFSFKKYLQFSSAEKEMIFKKRVGEDVEAIFLGADEIWSLVNNTFEARPEFYGENILGVRKFSYAPSAGNTKIDIALENEVFQRGIRSLDKVSARDENTKKIADSILGGKDVPLVLDPAFLCDFPVVHKPRTDRMPYAVVYTYGMSKARVGEVKQYARKNNLKLISPGFNNRWCDEVIMCSPFDFLSLIKNAECVITDTFHGTVFSIKYAKNFACYASGKTKIIGLLDELGLNDAIIKEGDLLSCGKIATDYINCEPRLKALTRESNMYLDECVNFLVNSTLKC
jgi:hypothetical protein